MAFDWPKFFDAHSVPYATRGPNVGRRQVNIRCPWCGPSDPSEHLSISLDGLGYRCLRNPHGHAGKSRPRLIQAVLGCEWAEACRLAGYDQITVPEDEDMVVSLRKLLDPEDFSKVLDFRPKLKFPEEVHPLGNKQLAVPFWEYLRRRKCKYSAEAREWLVRAYNLHYATTGKFRYRLIFPIYDERGRLMTWTGRDITEKNPARYKTHSIRDGALDRPTNLLLGLPLLFSCKNPEVLVLCEGPFDAVRISVLGHRHGVYGTCLFGLNVSSAQVVLLDRLMTRFGRLILLVDPDARYLILRLRDSLEPLVPEVGALPEGAKDPGDLTREDGRTLINSWLM